MGVSSTFELGVLVSIQDRARGWMEDASRRWENLRSQIKLTGEDLEWFESMWGRMKGGIALVGVGAAALALSGQMAMARVEATQLEAEIISLGVSSQAVRSISDEATVLSAKWGIAKNSVLSGVYDLRSAVSSLEGSSLGSFTESVVKTAKATKGNFEELSKTFGMVYNQFGDKYPWLTQEEFAESLGNTIAFTAQRFRADGASIKQAFETLGASASVAGYTAEAQSVTIGRLLNTMVPSTAGTSLRAFIDRLPQAGDKLGIDVFDQMTGKLRPIPDILESINEKYPDLAKNSGVLNEAFSEEGMKFLKAMVPEAGKLRDDIRELSEMNAAKNFAILDSASATNVESFSGSLDRLREGLSALWADMGEGPAVVLHAVVAPLADMVQGFASITREHPGLARILGTTVMIGGALTLVAGVVIAANAAWTMYRILQYQAAIASASNLSASSAMGIGQTILAGRTWIATTAQWAFNAALWANPITWVVGGVLAFAAGLAYVIYNWDDLKSRWEKMPEWVHGTLWMVTAIFELGTAVAVFTDNLDDVEKASRLSFGQLPDWIKIGMSVLTPMIHAPLAIASNWTELKTTFGQVIRGDLSGALSSLGGIAERSGFGFVGRFFTGVTTMAKSGLSTLTDMGKKAGMGFVKAIGDGISAGAGMLIGRVQNVFSQVGEFLPHSDAKTGPLSTLTYSGRATVETFAEGMATAVPDLTRTTESVMDEADFAGSGIDGGIPALSLEAAGGSAGSTAAPQVNLQLQIQNLIGQVVAQMAGGELEMDEMSLAKLIRNAASKQVESFA